MKRGIKFSNAAWLAQILLMALSGNIFAAPELSADVNARGFFVGDGFVWTLAVKGAKQVDSPELPALPDFFQQALEPQILEQGTAKTFVYRYRLIPRRSGLLTLPPATVLADEAELTTAPRVLNVGEPQTTNGLRLELTLDHREVYAGGPVTLTCKLLTTLSLNNLKALDLRLPLLYDPRFDVIVPAAERVLGGQPGTIGLPVEGQRVIGALSDLKINDESFAVITFRRILVPHEAGQFTFPPARILCSYLTQSPLAGRRGQQRYPSYFDNDFFQDTDGQEAYVRYGAQSAALTLKVLPLPETNRPPDFSGIVGHGEMTAMADPQTLLIGDPVTLTVRLSGFAVPEALALPPLAKLANFSGQFLVPETQSPARVLSNNAVCVQSIRPLRTAVTEVPPLKLVVFNPATRQYETLATKPIPLRIRPDGDITAIDLGPNTPSARTVNPSGIWNNLPADAVDPLTRAGQWVKWTAPAWLLLPPVLFFALAGKARMHHLRRTDPERWRRLTAFARLRRDLAHVADADAQRVGAADYLATRLGIQAAALSEREVLRALNSRAIEVTEETRLCLRELFLRPDLNRFGREPSPPPPPLDAARLIAALEALERRFES